METTKNKITLPPNTENPLAIVDTPTLMKLLNSGRATATALGTAAQARIEIGTRVFWHTEKIRKYLDKVAS